MPMLIVAALVALHVLALIIAFRTQARGLFALSLIGLTSIALVSALSPACLAAASLSLLFGAHGGGVLLIMAILLFSAATFFALLSRPFIKRR